MEDTQDKERQTKQVSIIFNLEDYQIIKEASKKIAFNPTGLIRSSAVTNSKKIIQEDSN